MRDTEDAERVEVRTLAEARAWLAVNHGRAEGVWLVTWKKRPGAPHVGYGDLVDELLCFGWIDNLSRKLDDARSMLWVAPRRAGSGWSKVNKEKLVRLEAEGRMHAAGHARVAAAIADGSWTKLDAAHALEMPADLAAALAAAAPATANFAVFSPSSRRAILEWIGAAKKPETRAKRIAETARLAQRNIKANHPAARQAP